MDACPLADTPPVRPPVTTGADQLKVVPAGTIVPGGVLTSNSENGSPLHMFEDCIGITGEGLTVTVMVKLVPVQDAVVDGVTVYVAV
jgi:hypothetical protein